VTDNAEIRRLILQIERGVLARDQLKVLVAAADAAIAGHRRDLRNLQAATPPSARKPVRSK
jgi:hypothetical protein